MSGLSRRLQSILAAAVLAALTLTVFGLTQNSGPESAVRRFHEALLQGSGDRLAAELADVRDVEAARELRARVLVLLQNRARVGVAKVVQEGKNARVFVTYQLPQQGLMAIIPFALRKSTGAWLVDARKTLDLIQQSLTG